MRGARTYLTLVRMQLQMMRNEFAILLEDFEPEPLPVSIVYPHAKLASATVRAFIEACRPRLQEAAFA